MEVFVANNLEHLTNNILELVPKVDNISVNVFAVGIMLIVKQFLCGNRVDDFKLYPPFKMELDDILLTIQTRTSTSSSPETKLENWVLTPSGLPTAVTSSR